MENSGEDSSIDESYTRQKNSHYFACTDLWCACVRTEVDTKHSPHLRFTSY